jgi:hypothetical protein
MTLRECRASAPADRRRRWWRRGLELTGGAYPEKTTRSEVILYAAGAIGRELFANVACVVVFEFLLPHCGRPMIMTAILTTPLERINVPE